MCVHTRPSVSRPHTHLQRADTFTTGQLSRPQEVLNQCMNDGEREVEIEVFLPTETRLFFFLNSVFFCGSCFSDCGSSSHCALDVSGVNLF